MANNGKARILTNDDWNTLFAEIATRRHPEKNTAIMRISRHLGLRAQEIALLKVKDVAKLDARHGQPNRQFTLYELMTVPADITKGANAMRKSESKYVRKSLTFKVDEFDQTVRQIVEMAKHGVDVDPSLFYPVVRNKTKSKGRELPVVSKALINALTDYLRHRLDNEPYLKMNSPLFLSQRNRAYSPNSLQEHMALMLRGWAGVEKAKSHSGRRSLATDIIHKQKKSIKVAQEILGHKSPTTTVIYDQPPEGELADALKNLDNKD